MAEDERRTTQSADLVREFRESGGRLSDEALVLALGYLGGRDVAYDNPLPNLEVSGHIERFSAEQVAGLKAVEFDFVVPTYAKSLTDLVQEGHDIQPYIDDSERLFSIVPPATEVAVRSRRLGIPASGRTTLEERLKMVADLEKELKQRDMPENATLEGVTFGLGRASTHAQIEIGHVFQKRKPLYTFLFAATEDFTTDTDVAEIARRQGVIEVFDRDRNDAHGGIWVVPVALPVAKAA